MPARLSRLCATLSRGGAEKAAGSRKIEKPVNRRIARPSQAGECFRVGGNTSRGSSYSRCSSLAGACLFVASSFVAPFLKVLQSFYSTVSCCTRTLSTVLLLVLYSTLHCYILPDAYFFQIYSSLQRAVQAVSRDNIRIERECILFLNSSKLVKTRLFYLRACSRSIASGNISARVKWHNLGQLSSSIRGELPCTFLFIDE